MTVAGTNSAVGSYPILVTLNDPNGKLVNYSVTTNNGLLTVLTRSLVVSANATNKWYGAEDPPLTYQITSGQLVNGESLTGALTRVPGENAGTYAILQGTLTATTNYLLTYQGTNLTINPDWLTVMADDQSRAYGSTNPVLTLLYNGFVNGEGVSNLTTLPQAATLANPASSVGDYDITVSGGSAINYRFIYASGVLSVTPAPLMVTAANAARVYGATNPVFGGAITGLQNGDNITATYASAATPTTPVGGFSIVPSLVDPNGKLGNYSVTSNDGTLTISPALLTGQADGKSRFYGATNPVFTATYTGFVNGETNNLLSGALTGVTPAATNSPVGNYPINVSGQSAANYTVQYVAGTLSVVATPLLVAGNNSTRAYGETNPVFTASINGWVNNEGTNVLGGTLVVSTPANTNSAVGTYPIIPSGLTSTNYAISYTNGTLTVTSYALSVTASNASRSYGAANPVFTGSLSGLQNGDNITANFSTTATTNSAVSNYVIVATLNDPFNKLGNYAVTTNNGTLSVTAATLSVVASNASRVYGATNPVFSGALTGVQNGDNITATYASAATPASTVGSYSIVPGLVDPNSKLSNYTVNVTNGTLNVTAAALSVSANNASRVYGATNPVFNGTLAGILNGDDITATYASAATPATPVGGYSIVPSLADPNGKLGNYAVTSSNGTLTINPALLTGQADGRSRFYGATNPVFTATYTGFVNGETNNILSGTLMGATSATTNSPVGNYPITVSGQSAANYTVQYLPGTLSVVATPLLVSGNNAGRAYGLANPVFTVSINGWVNDEGTNVLGGTLVVSTPADTNSAVGTYPIIPSGLTSTNYAIGYTNGTLTVTSYALSVTASNASRSYGTANPVLTGTLTGLQNGDNITASFSTTATTNSAVSNYVIIATLNDPSNKLSNYAVTTNNGTLSVTAAALSVTANNASRVYGATNPVFSGTLTGIQNGDNITATYSSAATPASTVGIYGIVPTLVDPNGKLSNYTVSSTNGTLSVAAAALSVAANNASRVYGATNPLFSGTLTGLQNGDNITATYASAATPASTVGMYGIVPTLVDPSGKLSNYTVSSTNGTLNVTAAVLSVSANNASRVYGATNPVFNGILTGIQNGDNITATYASPATSVSTVGSYNIVPTLVDPSGKLSNYTVSSTNGTLNVTAAALSVTANNASRVYGATNPVFSGTLTGVQNGDNITATYASAATPTSTVGSYSIVPSLVDPSGKLSNYTVNATNGTLNVTAAALSVVANNASRVYGATNPVFSGTLTGIQNGDNITANYASPATPASTVGAYNIVPTLLDPNGKLTNYTVSTTNGTLNVTAAALSVAANNASRVYGSTNPVFSGTLTGIQNGDNITATYASAAAPGSSVGNYSIVPSLIDPNGKLGNYVISSSNGSLTITAAALSVTANDASRPYGVANPAFTGTIVGLKNGDNITAVYASTATPSSPVGNYTIVPSLMDPGSKLTNYSVALTNGTLTVTVSTNPIILSITLAGSNNVVVTWTSISNRYYQVQYKTSVGGTNWLNASPEMTATSNTTSFTDHPGAGPRFYRIAMLSSLTPVTPPPVIQSIVGAGTSNVVITWTAVSNRIYRVQFKALLGSTSWQDFSPDVTAVGGTASFTDHPGNASPRFYRVAMLPNTPPPGSPIIQSVTGAGTTNVVITWSATSNNTYRVQYKTDSTGTNWTDLSPYVLASGGTANYTDHPPLGESRYYQVVVVTNAPPVIHSIVGAGTTNVVLTWSAISSRTYQVQYKTNFSATNWSAIVPNVVATGITATLTDHPPAGSPRLYRVGLLP